MGMVFLDGESFGPPPTDRYQAAEKGPSAALSRSRDAATYL
jgi:hypothetical protein